jgi:hypothetical protein
MVMISRRQTFASGLALAVTASASPYARTKCVLGAIRWDGQYCDTPGQPCFEEEKSLGPGKWRFRAPLHTQVLDQNRISFQPNQETFDREIAAAAAGGLDYWAYLMYGENGSINIDHSMMAGLKFHRASKIKNQMNYAMMITANTIGFSRAYDNPIAKLVDLMRDTNYQVTHSGRPVVYFYYQEQFLKDYWDGSLLNLAQALGALRISARGSGMQNPYIVVVTSPPSFAERLRSALGGDAISTYAVFVRFDSRIPYSRLANATRSYWEAELAATNSGVVPTVMIGWDTRPRREHPPAWEKGEHPLTNLDSYVTPPTPTEFTTECQAAFDFISAHPIACASGLALIYAWNEDSEGGPLEPTLGDPEASKLKALGQIVR